MLVIQFYRLQRGWSQKTLASLAATNQPTVSNIEQGRRRPSDTVLANLARALDVSPAFTLLRPVEQVLAEARNESVMERSA